MNNMTEPRYINVPYHPNTMYIEPLYIPAEVLSTDNSSRYYQGTEEESAATARRNESTDECCTLL